MIKSTKNSITITENQQRIQNRLSFLIVVLQIQYFNLCVKKIKQDGDTYYPNIHLEECMYTEKITE